MERRRLTRKLDVRNISVEDDYIMEYWTKYFAVSSRRLKEAMHIVGNTATEVKSYLSSGYVKKSA